MKNIKNWDSFNESSFVELKVFDYLPTDNITTQYSKGDSVKTNANVTDVRFVHNDGIVNSVFVSPNNQNIVVNVDWMKNGVKIAQGQYTDAVGDEKKFPNSLDDIETKKTFSQYR